MSKWSNNYERMIINNPRLNVRDMKCGMPSSRRIMQTVDFIVPFAKQTMEKLIAKEYATGEQKPLTMFRTDLDKSENDIVDCLADFKVMMYGDIRHDIGGVHPGIVNEICGLGDKPTICTIHIIHIIHTIHTIHTIVLRYNFMEVLIRRIDLVPFEGRKDAALMFNRYTYHVTISRLLFDSTHLRHPSLSHTHTHTHTHTHNTHTKVCCENTQNLKSISYRTSR